MKKEQIIKHCAWKFVRLFPPPKRFEGGKDGAQLPDCDRDWKIGNPSAEGGVPISLDVTGHAITLNWDNVVEYDSDPARGEGYGFLTLKLQMHMGGNEIWFTPILVRSAASSGESESERKLRAILQFKGKTVKLSEMNTGRAVLLLGPVRGSSHVQVFDCNEFSVTVGMPGHGGFSRNISLNDIEICLDGNGLELQVRYS
jgi:hypothetical protein